jgi:hypothetical protein
MLEMKCILDSTQMQKKSHPIANAVRKFRPLAIGAKNAGVLFVGRPVEANSTESNWCKF